MDGNEGPAQDNLRESSLYLRMNRASLKEFAKCQLRYEERFFRRSLIIYMGS